jgi:hypothetical protein
MEFDYYSLGVVSLEIAHWKSLSILCAGSAWQILPPEIFRDALIKQALKLSLEQAMGAFYCKAMRVCLNGDFAESQVGGRFD